ESGSGGVGNAGGSANSGGESSGGTTASGGAEGTGGAVVVGGETACDGSDESELLAFPCAEGYGKVVVGGRGGSVYEVTNLNSSGPGSFGDALSAGNRTIVFRVAGTIEGNFTIAKDNITIAGQSAPGDGIA